MKGPFLGMTGTKLPHRRSSARLSKRAKVDTNGTATAAVPVAAVAPKAPSPPVASPPKARVPSAPKAARAQAPKQEEAEQLELLSRDEITRCTTLPQPHLSFSLQEAKEHLCRMDVRFGPLFDQIELGMYKEMLDGEVKELNLFRTITTSIVGQQISWLAARSVLYKFCRVYAPSLPETPSFDTINREKLPFPHPLDVLETGDEKLRQAGLSFSKIKYVKDIARRFADGRLDIRRIVELDAKQCIEHLTQAKGVGRWTAEMMLMFALRHPDIVPVGDLGVQRGMVYFYTSGPQGPSVSERKKRKCAVPSMQHKDEAEAEAALEPAPVVPEQGPIAEPLPLPPSATTTLATLRSRAAGNKTKKNVYLDAEEMEALAQPWAPFRSVACMFMWSLIDS